MTFDLAGYVDVAERIREFRAAHPQGTLQAEIVELPAAFAGQFIAVKAYAYRTPDDERPGTGLAYEPVPGKTSFTKDSELQNAETSAIGRAIVSVGAADTKRGIASAEEVRNRQADQDAPPPPPPDPAVEDLRAFMGTVKDMDEEVRARMNEWWQARDKDAHAADLLDAGRAVLAGALADGMRGADDAPDVKPPDPELTVTPEQIEERAASGACVGCGKPFSKSGKHVQDVGDPLYAATCAPF